MDFFNSWLFSLEDAIDHFLTEANSSQMSIQPVLQLFDTLNYPRVYCCSYTLMSFERLVFMQGVLEENYTGEEIKYMNYSQQASLLFKINKKSFVEDASYTLTEEIYDYVTFFYVNIDCVDSEKDIIACALTKIINKAFEGLNIILFKCPHEFCFGLKQLHPNSEINNFIISKWFSERYSAIDLSNLSFDEFEGSSPLSFYNSFLEYITENSHLILKKPDNYNVVRFINADYIQALKEIDSYYGVNTLKTIQRREELLYQDTVIKCDIYDEIANELRYIGIETISSIDMLQIAENHVHYKTDKFVNKQTRIIEYDEIDHLIRQIDDEDFDNAEKLLKYI